MEITSSVWVANEQAHFLLYHVWIHVLGSKSRPLVQRFEMNPHDVVVLPEEDEQGGDWEKVQAFRHEFSQREQEAMSPFRFRVVEFTFSAFKTDQKPHVLYELNAIVYLRNAVPSLEWYVSSFSNVNLRGEGGSFRSFDQWPGCPDLMNDRHFLEGSPLSRYDRAVTFFAM